MPEFKTKMLPAKMDAVAPDGSEVRILLDIPPRGGMAHFLLPAGQVSKAVQHKTVEEIWYFLSGSGEMWRKSKDHEEVMTVESGVCITIPLGTEFQFRSNRNEPLTAIGVTMPPWPGENEAVVVAGKWQATIKSI